MFSRIRQVLSRHRTAEPTVHIRVTTDNAVSPEGVAWLSATPKERQRLQQEWLMKHLHDLRRQRRLPL